MARVAAGDTSPDDIVLAVLTTHKRHDLIHELRKHWLRDVKALLLTDRPGLSETERHKVVVYEGDPNCGAADRGAPALYHANRSWWGEYKWIIMVDDDVIVSADNLAYLVQRDTVHGRFEKSVTASEGALSCEGVSTRCTSERDPANLPWAELGVDYVLESTGLFTTGYDAGKHLAAGAKRVLISAPTKTPDEVKTLVYKVNHEQYDPATDQIRIAVTSPR